MSPRFIDAATVRRLLPPIDCIEVMARAMVQLSQGAVAVPPRVIASLIDGSGFLGVMPGSASDPPVYGAKVVGLHPANPAAGRPLVQGVVVLFDHATGVPLAIVDGAEITTVRTAAASALATKLLARPDVETHGLLGTGVQAMAHAVAIQAIRPSVRETLIWGRTPSHAEALAERLRATGVAARAVEAAADAAGCDVVSAVTGAATPVLEGRWLAAGAHVNLVGAHRPTDREADTATVLRSRVYVDSLPGALTEAGDLLLPISEGAFDASRIVGEIGALAAGAIPGRSGREEVTLYKSLGSIAQDLFAAWTVFERAEQALGNPLASEP